MSNTFSKSSVYIDSLVGFTLDTKPYHTKLTEVAVEYRFEDTVNASIIDAVASRMVKKAGWLYGFVSGGDANNRSFPLKRAELPHIRRHDFNSTPPGAFKVGRDENTDMLNVPLVFDKKSTVGIADAWLERGVQSPEYLTNGIDFHHSHGSMEFRVSSPTPMDTDQSLRWAETRAEATMTTVNATTRYLALQRIDDTQPWSISNSHPNSANFRIRQVLDAIQSQLTLTPDPISQAALNSLFTILNTPDLPQTYENLWVALTAAGTPIISHPVTGTPFAGWQGEDGVPAGSTYVDDYVSQNTPPAYFNALSDQRLRESGGAVYADRVFTGFAVSSVSSNPTSAVDEWTLTVVSTSPLTIEVSGAVHGTIGGVIIGTPFTSTHVSFNTAAAPGTPTIGQSFVVTPSPRLVISSSAPQEVWNVIKTPPMAYDRPIFTSTRYGFIQDISGTVGRASILDATLPSGTVILTATSATTFLLSSTADPTYVGNIQVGVPFNDGRLGFTVMAGTAQPFSSGDKFYINIVNQPAYAAEFDLYYGYDLDSYDNQQSLYENTDVSDPDFGRPLDFKFDSRFSDYDIQSMGLQLSQGTIAGHKYRLVAIPDGDAVDVLHSDGVTFSNGIDLAIAGGGTVPVFSMTGSIIPDLSVRYANSFQLQRSDDGGATWSIIEFSIPVGVPYSHPDGVSFTITPGSKPFIAVTTPEGVRGGDVFAWTVVNAPPRLDPSPVIFSSANVPRLVMHPDGFWWAPAATWTIAFTSSTSYTVSALHTSGPNTGTLVSGYPVTGDITVNGPGLNRNFTFRDDLVHFTVKQGGRGFATGDYFTFHTFDRKPSILVHGSASGWQAPAAINEWYWNDKIGFKVGYPNAAIFKAATRLTQLDPDFAAISVTRVRPDAPSLVYTFTRVAPSASPVTFSVTRSDKGAVGFCPLVGIFADEYVTVSVDGASSSFQVVVTPDEFQFWNATDTVVVTPQLPAFAPTSSDFYVFKKANADRIGVSLRYSNTLSVPDTTSLGQVGIDPAFIDISTGGVPIEAHSPEATILSGWLPVTLSGFDSSESIAHFPDVATEVELTSAVSGETVGRVYSEGAIDEPVRFEWDQTFFSKYLPINTTANVVVYNSVMNEDVAVAIAERINFIQSGGILIEDALFRDDVNVSVSDRTNLSINLDQVENVQAVIADGPFGGFLSGYDNLRYELETGVDGQFDTGVPLTDNFLRAKYLSSLPALTQQQQEELAVLSGLVADYLVGDVASTSLAQFLAAMDTDPYRDGIEAALGIPTIGAAIDITQAPTATASTSIAEGLSFVSVELPDTFGMAPFGTSTYPCPSTAIMVVISNPVIPPSQIPSTYADFITPFYSPTPVGCVEIRFPIAPATTPSFAYWTPAMASPQTAAVVEQVSPRVWRFSLAQESEVKVIIT